jgi:hypothetical protein
MRATAIGAVNGVIVSRCFPSLPPGNSYSIPVIPRDTRDFADPHHPVGRNGIIQHLSGGTYPLAMWTLKPIDELLFEAALLTSVQFANLLWRDMHLNEKFNADRLGTMPSSGIRLLRGRMLIA